MSFVVFEQSFVKIRIISVDVSFDLFICLLTRPVTARGLRLQAGHGPAGGRHRQPHNRSDPQP